MALDPKATATLVSARELPGIVEKAVREAGQHVEGAGALVVRWDLIGREIRDFAKANEFASAVVKGVGAHGIAATPAVLAIDKKIIAGFFERSAIPQIRNL